MEGRGVSTITGGCAFAVLGVGQWVPRPPCPGLLFAWFHAIMGLLVFPPGGCPVLSVSALPPCGFVPCCRRPCLGFFRFPLPSPLFCLPLSVPFLPPFLPSASVFVGCAAGADAVARGLFPAAQVFSVASGQWGAGRSAFARRSVAVVSAVVSAGGSAGLWCFFPAAQLPCRVVAFGPVFPLLLWAWVLGLGPLPPLPWGLVCRCLPSCRPVFLPLLAGVLSPWGVVGGWPALPLSSCLFLPSVQPLPVGGG